MNCNAKGLPIMMVAALALLVSACTGGSSSGPGVAAIGPTTTQPASAPTSPEGSSTEQAASDIGSATPTHASTFASPGPATSSSALGSSGESTQSQELQLAHCMRSNGVPNFPDPSPGGGLLNAISAAGIDTQSPAYEAAFQACQKYAPAGNGTPQSAADNAKALRFSQCMRSHGVPNYPDPITGPTGGQAINLGPEHIDPTSPLFQTAHTACQKLFPGSK
jgi:hypothetical protein